MTSNELGRITMTKVPDGSICGLRFYIGDLIKEAEALDSIGKDFFDRSRDYGLLNLVSQLNAVWSADHGKQRRLQLDGLRTIPTDVRGTELFVDISGVWDLTPIGDNSRKSKIKSTRNIAFSGIASTKFELYISGQCNRIAMWKIELGTVDSPGCYFHAQVLGDSPNPPFPEAVKIPRFPSFFVTPMAAIDYALGELFGLEWERAAIGSSYYVPYWRELQRHRLKLLFKWCHYQVDNEVGSPWMALKAAKPASGMFT